MELDIMDIITAAGGTAGAAALAKVLLDHHRGRKAARLDATKAASEASELLFQRHAQEFDRLGERLDTLENRNNELVAQLAEKHDALVAAETKLVEMERKLLVAQADAAHKERVITRLQEQIATLEATIVELRAQVESLTQALAKCTNQRNSTSTDLLQPK